MTLKVGIVDYINLLPIVGHLDEACREVPCEIVPGERVPCRGRNASQGIEDFYFRLRSHDAIVTVVPHPRKAAILICFHLTL